MAPDGDVEPIVRARLRSLRESRDWSLDELAERTRLSASTISRIETGKRAVSLDVLQPLCRALETDLRDLLDVTTSDGDIVIRPRRRVAEGVTFWPLTRFRGATGFMAWKMLLEPAAPQTAPRVHPGHDWFFVLSGTVLLTLGTRDILVQQGEAADFSTMTPHSFAAHKGPAEIISIFDRDGHNAHLDKLAASAPTGPS